MLALWLSGGAIAVALAAAGFAAWQAVTAHLARVRPLRADWVYEFRGRPAHRPQESGWFLRNVGGSTATDVRLTVRLVRPTKTGLVERTWEAEGPIPAGGAIRMTGSAGHSAAGQWYVPKPGEPNLMEAAELDHAGKPIGEAARRLWQQWATVAWTDDRGKRRERQVALY